MSDIPVSSIHPDAVVFTQGLPDSSDARFGLRLLQSFCRPDTSMALGMTLEQGLEFLPARNENELVLWTQSAWLTPERHCLPRLLAALRRGADVAWACDSEQPFSMHPAAYATLRGMERFVTEHSVQSVSVATDHQAKFGLATRAGWQKFLADRAQVVRVEGAWVHDASSYFGSERREVLPLLPPKMQKMLDVGGGEGGFLAAVKEAQPQVFTQLVELSSTAAAIARTKAGIDGVWVGSFFDWQPADRYDCISLLEVLEHVVDPEQALLHAKNLLSPTGMVLMSVPNVSHWSVVADLLEGRWDWATEGIHCYTHVRFFTRHTIDDMLSRVGLIALEWFPVKVPCPPDWRETWRVPGLTVDADALDVYAYVVCAAPVGDV